jgi:peptide/nickel transport system substrate-binding protein
MKSGAAITAAALALRCGYATPTFAQEASGEAPRRGGTLRYANTDTLKPLRDPATIDALGPADAVRGVAEFLTVVDENNLPHPHLLEKLDASEDLKTWTLVVRSGPTFNLPTPRALDADDVIFNLKRWLDPATGSSMNGLLQAYLKEDGIEKVDDRTVVLHLTAPTNTLAYDFYHYAGAIMPREFKGDFIAEPWGTGPFELVEYVPNQSFTLRARKNYWRNGADGQPLPYLDEVVSIDIKSQAPAQIAGLVSGEFDLALGLDVSSYQALSQRPEIVVSRTRSAGTLLFRMRVDLKPFDDPKVRLALKLCQNREQIIALALGDTAFLGTDDMVAPEVDPAWAPMDAPAQDIDRAKALLAEAGLADGFETEMRYPAAPEFIGACCQVFAQNALQIGVKINLVPMPADAYWAKWLEWGFGASYWSHRPLATMVLGLSLRAGAPWNETRFNDPEFERLLDDATRTVSVEARRETYARLQPYLRENGPFAEPLFIYALAAQTKRVKNFKATAFRYGVFDDTWIEG